MRFRTASVDCIKICGCDNCLNEQIVIAQEKAKLLKQIEDLEKKAHKEIQAKKKFEMFLRLKEYQKRLEEM